MRGGMSLRGDRDGQGSKVALKEEGEISQPSAGSSELNRSGHKVNMKEVICHSGEMV